MITARAFAGKHYAVLGLARSGLATVEALLASGAKVTAWDDDEAARDRLKPSPRFRGEVAAQSADGGAPPPCSTWSPSPANAGEDLTIADLDTADLSQFDSIVVTPGLPLNRHPIAGRAKAAGVEIIGDIELFARARPELPPHKVVGITGTNGKSTTTALVHHILQTAGVPSLMGGNIGLPILAQDPLPEGGVYVLELSSYQIDLTQSLDCDVAVLLNITPDHLDRYEGFEAYAASKARLFAMQSAGKWAVFAGNDQETDKLCNDLNQSADREVIWVDSSFEETLGVSLFEGDASIYGNPVGKQGDWPTLQGPHNAENAGAAIGIGHALGLSIPKIANALRTYPGLPHRMERIRDHDGVRFVNDSKATNATATAPALAAFPAIRWILGGRAKSDELDECAPFFAHVRSAYTIGEAGALFARILGEAGVAAAECGTLEVAVKAAAHDAEPGDTVLMSPACASFDQFRDFEARGDAFRELVRAL